MENRKRNIQMKFYVTEEEKRLIDEKMKQLPIFKGDFSFPLGKQHTGSVYGSMANDYPAIGVMGVLDMFFVFFLGHGKSPFL